MRHNERANAALLLRARAFGQVRATPHSVRHHLNGLFAAAIAVTIAVGCC